MGLITRIKVGDSTHNMAIPFITCSASASSLDKGSFASGVLTDETMAGAQFYIKFTNGNTASAPTITIDTITGTIEGYGNTDPSKYYTAANSIMHVCGYTDNQKVFY